MKKHFKRLLDIVNYEDGVFVEYGANDGIFEIYIRIRKKIGQVF